MQSSSSAIAVIGHESGDLSEIERLLSEKFAITIYDCDQEPQRLSDFDGAIFAISAFEGLASSLLPWWEQACALLLPRMILVTKIENSESDFDEAILIARRVLGECHTPYLVLHDDGGAPCAFIDLEQLTIRDYSTGTLKLLPAEEDHKVLIAEFREEFLNDTFGLDDGAFSAGFYVPALAFSSKLKLGVSEVELYLSRLKKLF